MKDKQRDTLAALVRRCRDGDAGAWDSLVDHVAPLIFSICSRMRLSREESFDIFGEVLYTVLTNIDRLKQPGKIVSYVGTTTRRAIYAQKRRLQRQAEFDDSAAAQIPDKPERTPEKQVERDERREVLLTALAKLPDHEYRLVRTLFMQEHQPSYEETSRELGIPISSIGPTRARALEKLRRILKRMNYDFGYYTEE